MGSAGFDLSACSDGVVPKGGSSEKINVGVQFAFPRGTYGHIFSKSSVTLAGVDVCAGIIDSDYRGDVQVVLRNNGDQDWHYKSGQKVAQMLVKRYLSPDPVSVNKLPSTQRGDGGFGSTGTGLVASD